MNLKRFRNQLLLLSVALLASCSSDTDESWEYQPENKITTRAVSDLFNVEYLSCSDVGFDLWYDEHVCVVDSKSNFYYATPVHEHDVYPSSMKINLEFNSINLFTPADTQISYKFCFDENDNFCHLIYENNSLFLRRIKSDGSSWFDQRLSVPSNDFLIDDCYSMCGSPEGYLYYINRGRIHQISLRGVVTVIDVDLSSVDFNSDTQLHKANGNNFYITTANKSVCHWINIDTKTVEEIQLGFNLGLRSSACAGESLYSLNGQYIVKITPGQPNVDLGTIPTMIRNSSGKYDRMYIDELYVNKDATIFYTIGYFAETHGICKLTL